MSIDLYVFNWFSESWYAESGQESNDLSGSRGEANFVWRCKSCKVYTSFYRERQDLKLKSLQRESSATIKAPPAPYQQASPPKPQNVIEFDCRGLEFTEFKADVRL